MLFVLLTYTYTLNHYLTIPNFQNHDISRDTIKCHKRTVNQWTDPIALPFRQNISPYKAINITVLVRYLKLFAPIECLFWFSVWCRVDQNTNIIRHPYQQDRSTTFEQSVEGVANFIYQTSANIQKRLKLQDMVGY